MKIPYDINSEAVNISVLSSGKIRRYKYLPGEDILPSNQQKVIAHAKFTCSPLGKAFEKKLKTIEDQGKKQVHVLENLKPKEGTKPTEDKSNYKSQIAIIFDNLF